MQLPSNLVPLLEQVRRRIPVKNVPLDFWRIESGPRILDGFMDLANLLRLSDLTEEDVPRGYVVLASLFSWEADCQADGWGAFANVDDKKFERLCSFYSQVGLEAEARSLVEQMRVFTVNPNNLEARHQAASSTRHELSGDLDRLEYLTQYFCDHADQLLYAGT